MGFFDKAHSEFDAEYEMLMIGHSETEKIINKLCRHFKLPKVNVTFDKKKPGGTYYYPKNISPSRTRGCVCDIDLHKESFSIGTIIHEVGHHMDFIKNGSPKGRRWHNNGLLPKIRRLARYCKKMGYWGWTVQKNEH